MPGTEIIARLNEPKFEREAKGKQWRNTFMLAEKFLLILETLLSCGVVQTGNYPDGSPRLISRAPFVPIK
jgi:hypothetical protein